MGPTDMKCMSPSVCFRPELGARLFVSAGLLFVSAFISPSRAEAPQMGVQSILAISKMAGACGILNELIDFQARTKMPGGDEFVLRFWQTESARQGFSPEKMMERCKQAVSGYDRLWRAGEPGRPGN